MKLVRTILTSSLCLKISSLIIGFLLWSTVNDLFTYTKWFTIPLCFYNAESLVLSAPQAITLELSGKRSHIRQIASDSLAAHIDAHTLRPGNNLLAITRDHLLMPPSIQVTTVIPHSVIVQVTRTAQ